MNNLGQECMHPPSCGERSFFDFVCQTYIEHLQDILRCCKTYCKIVLSAAWLTFGWLEINNMPFPKTSEIIYIFKIDYLVA